MYLTTTALKKNHVSHQIMTSFSHLNEEIFCTSHAAGKAEQGPRHPGRALRRGRGGGWGVMVRIQLWEDNS